MAPPKAVMSVSLSMDVAEAVGKLADHVRKPRSEVVEMLLKERLHEMVLEREAQAIKDVVALEEGTPVGRLKLWLAERNKSGLTTTPEEIAAKRAEFEAEDVPHA